MSTEHKVQRNLKNRHIQMIALGGAIGTGLFYGSGGAIGVVGPGIILGYAVGGIIIYFIMRALGEMLVDDPTTGSFSYYAYKYMGGFAGFLSGWNYWFVYVAVGMAELSVVGIYVDFWLPHVQQWQVTLICWAVITLFNLMNVKFYGEAEFWFALIKVVTIVAFIVVGIVMLVMHYNPGGGPFGLSNLYDLGGFLPNGINGLIMAMVMVMFSFGGVELVGIAAGEAADPRRSIPQAINQVVWRILIFYIGSFLVMLSLFSWRDIASGAAGTSPFVEVFQHAGLGVAAGVLNFVVLTAALSAHNSSLYCNSRMLLGLAQQGNAPQVFAKVSKHGVPYVAVLFSTLFTLVVVIANYFTGKSIFMIVMSIATGGIIINWVTILIAQMFYRARIPSNTKHFFANIFYPDGNIIGLVFLLGVLVIMAFDAETRIALIILPVWLFLLRIAYRSKQALINKYYSKRALVGRRRLKRQRENISDLMK